MQKHSVNKQGDTKFKNHFHFINKFDILRRKFLFKNLKT